MKSIEMKAHAKINLALDVLGKREDGYHELRMIMQTIELHDVVELHMTENQGIALECDCSFIPVNGDNIAFKAAKLLYDKFKIVNGVKIKISKRIPVAAGLAGGSTDAAAVLKGMNRLFSMGLSEDELMKLGKQLGADVPYCIKGGTMLAEGIGEVLTSLEPMQGINVVLIKPRIGVSTAWVYKSLRLSEIKRRPDTNMLVNALEKKDLKTLASNMVNVLETVTIEKHRVINEIKDKLLQQGAIGSLMSGSGPSVFGVFKNREDAQKAFISLGKGNWDCFLTKTI